MAKAQLDMFLAEDAQPFDAGPVVAVPDAGRVRGRLKAMLAEVQAGPVEPTRRRYIEKVAPQMSLALPEDERREMLAALEAGLERH